MSNNMDTDKYLSYVYTMKCYAVIKNNDTELQFSTWEDNHGALSEKAG